MLHVADMPEEHLEQRHEQVDPIVQEKYHEKLYVEVSVMSDSAYYFGCSSEFTYL